MNQNNEPKHAVPEKQCPYCKLKEVVWVDSCAIGAKLFVTLRGNDRGKKEIPGEYQLNN
jgi:hypothetical protein